MIHVNDLLQHEVEKYKAAWEIPSYHTYSPGHKNVSRFMDVLNPDPGSSIIDLGCGAGVAGLEFKKLGMNVTWLDLTSAGLSKEVPKQDFIESPLWDNWNSAGRHWDYGFCCDVLEHIPTEFTMLTIAKILESCDVLWLQIALRPDEFGKLVGEPLHLTVQPFAWWLPRIALLGKILDARDLIADGLFVVARE